jgi:hypothetical protein
MPPTIVPAAKHVERKKTVPLAFARNIHAAFCALSQALKTSASSLSGFQTRHPAMLDVHLWWKEMRILHRHTPPRSCT